MDILEHFPTSQKLGICFRLRMGPDETFEFKKVLRGGIDCFRLQRVVWARIKCDETFCECCQVLICNYNPASFSKGIS